MTTLASNDPIGQRKLGQANGLILAEPQLWRRGVTIWISILCLSAILCCWMLRPLRYAMARTDGGSTLLLDKRHGEVLVVRSDGVHRLGQ